MKLYFSPGACSLASHIALEETGLNHQLEKVNLKTHEYSGGSYYNVNPKGSVPALQLNDGQLLTESAVLLQYIADQKPESNLFPRQGSLERYRVKEWLNFVATEMHKGFSPLFNPRTPQEYRDLAIENIGRKLTFLNSHFEKNKFLAGDNMSIADLYLFVILRWATPMKVDLTKYPAVLDFIERMNARPSVQRALKAEETTH